MAAQLINYVYTDTKTGNYYTGQVVGDPTNATYAYQPNTTYQYGGGTYTTGAAVPTNAPVGSVYQASYYDAASKQTYNTWHYNPSTDKYYDQVVTGYDPNTGTYTPPAEPGKTATPLPQWSTKEGLGSEYSYIKTTDGKYHPYGGGGSAHAKITPDTVGTKTYDYKFLYPNGSYYLGKVYDDGTWNYQVGQKITKGAGTYDIYAVDPAPTPAAAISGQVQTLLYYDWDTKTNYSPSNVTPTAPLYQKSTGYGGLGSEHDYIQKPGGYYEFSPKIEASKSTALPTLPNLS